MPDLDGLLDTLAEDGIEPEKAPYGMGGTDTRGGYRIRFVADPGGYRIELINRAFPTPQALPHPSVAG